MLAGHCTQCAISGDIGFTIADCFFVKFALDEIVLDVGRTSQTKLGYSISRITNSKLLHEQFPFVAGITIEIFASV
ncbi:hypothetical protein D3C80_1880930 [compost metagenome]